MSNQQKNALAFLAVSIILGAVAQRMINTEAAVLGLSTFEVALIGVVAGGVTLRVT